MLRVNNLIGFGARRSGPMAGTQPIVVVPFNTPTSTGTIDITSSDMLGTPIAAMFFGGQQSGTGDLGADNWRFAQGATDGTNEWAVSSASLFNSDRTAQSPTGYHTDAACLALVDHGSTKIYEAEVDSFLTNGVRINFTTINATSYRCFAVLFYSASGQATAGIRTGATGTPALVNIGYRPDVIFGCSRMATTTLGTVQATTQANRISLGIAVDGVGQRGIGVSGVITGGAASQNAYGYLRNDASYVWHTAGSAGSLQATVALTFDASGFNITRNNGSTDVSTAFFPYLALSMPEYEFDLVEAALPTATGAHDFTTSLTDPFFAYQIFSRVTAANTGTSDACEIGAAAIYSERAASLNASHQGGSNGYTTQGFSDSAIYGRLGALTSSVRYRADVTGFASGEMATDFTVGPASATLAVTLFVGNP